MDEVWLVFGESGDQPMSVAEDPRPKGREGPDLYRSPTREILLGELVAKTKDRDFHVFPRLKRTCERAYTGEEAAATP
jgi:hypothetical protein